MDTAHQRVQDPHQGNFRDGLGIRRPRAGAAGPLEVLSLDDRLTALPSFEFLVRERAHRFAQFRHDSFARVHGIEHLGDGGSTLAVISDAVYGVRLSRILAIADQSLLPLDLSATLCLIQQLVAAVASLHESAPDACHGALAPERIVVTPDGRLVVAEHVLGAALEQLKYSRERYWSDLRIALPALDEPPRLNRRSDIVQVGTTALALLLNRPITGDEYPARIAALAGGSLGPGGRFEPMPDWLRSWLSQALWLDPRRSFASAVEARECFDAGLKTAGMSPSRKLLERFLAECALVEAKATDRPSAVVPGSPDEVIPPPDNLEEDADMSQTLRPWTLPALTGRRLRLIASAVVLVALISGGAMAARRYLEPPPSAAPATGTLAMSTNPAGANVVIDGEAHGTTPLSVTLKAGTHTLDLSSEGVHRTITVTVSPNTQSSQFIEMPKATPDVGELQVRTDPPGAKVSVDGQVRGVAPLTVSGLSAGSHVVTLENELGAVKENVTIDPGATASLVVPLKGTDGAPVSGWISIAAPAEIQVYEDERLLGSSRTDRIMVAAGRHELVFANEALGYRATQTIQVAPGQVAKVKPEWPQGSIAINAVPWANVWLDGEELGETPVGSTKVAIGTHEVVFRHPQFGEQHYTATVTAAAPARLSIDMRKK